MEPGILDACASGLQRLQALGCAVDHGWYNAERVWDAWLVLALSAGGQPA